MSHENTTPQIDKYDNHKKVIPFKHGTLCEKMPKSYLPKAGLSVFKREFLNLLYDSYLSWVFKIEFFPLQSNILITLHCLIVGMGSIDSTSENQ